jgi:hypothetical protein
VSKATFDLDAILSEITGGEISAAVVEVSRPTNDGTMRGRCPTCGKFANASIAVEVVEKPEGPAPKLVPWKRRHRSGRSKGKADETASPQRPPLRSARRRARIRAAGVAPIADP